MKQVSGALQPGQAALVHDDADTASDRVIER